ncbi:MAG: MFS transporter [Xanthobacteraceae bacterium]|nr:MFS transporter [Xanthobacteraceae bacterium]MBX3548185.1 MFS transporter [Xanthobacteraceae bacterium]
MEDASNHRRFINVAHFIDHYVLLVFPTVAIGLESALSRSYAELIVLSTACFVAFGLFSLPWGWLADHWSRRKIMAIFFFGCAVSMALAAAAPNVYWLAGALLLLGIFAAIYHPVGIPMLVSVARDRGRDFATNGVWGNFGVALAPGVTAALIHWVGLRAAFVVPAVICGAIGVAYLFLTKEETAKAGSRAKIAEVPLTGSMMVGVFAFFALMAFCGGTVFNILTIAIPKLIDERMTHDIPLVLLGSVATGVLLFGGVAQLTVGRLVSRFPPHVLLAGIGIMQVVGVLWAYYATGSMLLAALAVSIAAIYAQVTVGDVVIARYTADAWRGRVFAVRFFLAFITSGLAVWLISALLGKGGFDLVLLVTVVVALFFAFATISISILAGKAESSAASAQPAE